MKVIEERAPPSAGLQEPYRPTLPISPPVFRHAHAILRRAGGTSSSQKSLLDATADQDGDCDDLTPGVQS